MLVRAENPLAIVVCLVAQLAQHLCQDRKVLVYKMSLPVGKRDRMWLWLDARFGKAWKNYALLSGGKFRTGIQT